MVELISSILISYSKEKCENETNLVIHDYHLMRSSSLITLDKLTSIETIYLDFKSSK